MTTKERAAMQQALEALREYRDTQMISAPRKAIESLREALAEQPTHKFIPVGIVNDQHCITWMEEIVDDQAPIGSILYAKEQS